MANLQLCQLGKYHGLKILVDLIDHMDFKNSNMHYPKKERMKVNT